MPGHDPHQTAGERRVDRNVRQQADKQDSGQRLTSRVAGTSQETARQFGGWRRSVVGTEETRDPRAEQEEAAKA